MNQNYKVSVIVPIYNGIKYLQECIESIIHQTLTDIEIICVDDGSTDGTAEALDAYAMQDARIKVIHKPNSGYGHSMNVGIDNATGEYIGIVESDDYIDQNMYYDLYHYAKERDADIVKADYHTFFGEGNDRRFVYSPLFQERNKEYYHQELNYRKNFKVFEAYMVSWAGIYKREYLVKNDIRHNETPGASYQDNGFWFQNMIYGEKIYIVNKPYYYLRRDNENSSVHNRAKVFCVCDEYAFARECILKRNIDCDMLLNYFWQRCYGAYGTVLQRIAYEFKKDFLVRFAKDFRFAIDSDEFRQENTPENIWNKVNELLTDLDGYFNAYYKVGEDARGHLDKAEYIAVYGAKARGRDAVCDIQTAGYEDKLLGVVVTNKAGNNELVRYVFVSELSEIDYPKETLFVVAVQEMYQDEVIEALAQKGYYNIMRCQDMRR